MMRQKVFTYLLNVCCRVILVALWLLVASLLVQSFGEQDVPILTTLEFTPKSLLCTVGYKAKLVSKQHSRRLYPLKFIKKLTHQDCKCNAE
jgi:hypothetical protein